MHYVTEQELQKNLDYYLELSAKEDVFITRNNKVVSVLVSPQDKGYFDFMKLEGCLSKYDDGTNYEEMIADEILKK